MKSPEEEIEEALREDPDSDERWEHVVGLHRRGDEATFRAAASLLDNEEPARRALGADILAQLGAARDVPVAERKYAGPAVDLLLERVGAESDSEVLISMTHAFGHLHDPRCVPLLQELANHPDEDVRDGVVFGLLALDDDRAVATLIELSGDADPDVRDWATFGLGSQIERDDPTIREALLARLDDPHDNVRGEALRGLGARGDARDPAVAS